MGPFSARKVCLCLFVGLELVGVKMAGKSTSSVDTRGELAELVKRKSEIAVSKHLKFSSSAFEGFLIC